MSRKETMVPSEASRQAAELAAIQRMLALSEGRFSLSIATCNSPVLRDYLISRIRQDRDGIEVIAIPAGTPDVFEYVKSHLAGSPSAVFVTDLEQSLPSVQQDHPVLQALNASREQWEREMHWPVVIWLPEYATAMLPLYAADFWRYRSHRFDFVSETGTVAAGVSDRFAGDIGLASNLSADEKRFRIAELEQRVEQAKLLPSAALDAHVLVWLNELEFLLYTLGDRGRTIELLQQSLTLARKIGDRGNEAAALGNLGNAYHSLGEYRRAIEFHEQALVIAREMGDRGGEGTALGSLGLGYRSLGDYRRAIEFCEQHLEIAREIGDRGGEVNALCNLGNAYESMGEHRRAIEFHEQSREIALEIGDRHGEGNALGNLGNAYFWLGDYRRAIEFCEQHLEIAREIGDRQGEGNALFNWSLALDELGERDKAVELIQQSLVILEQIGSPSAETARKQLAEWQEKNP